MNKHGNVTMDDFYPPEPVRLEDFYPNGIVHRAAPKRRLGPDAAAALDALVQRLSKAAEAEIELITIMEFCGDLLSASGVDLKITRGSN